MKLILLSDCHILVHNPVSRLDDAHEMSMRKFKYILDRASELDGIILQAGDLFDRPRSWYLLPEMVDLLKHYEEKSVKLYSIFGQHDQYMYSHETRHTTNLGVLAEMGLVIILGKESQLEMAYGEKKVWIYGSGEGEKIPVVKRNGEGDINILVIHESISDRPMWPEHDHIQAKRFLLLHKDFDLILCGDIHRHFLLQLGDRVIVNTGPMMRKTADLWEHEPCFYVYNTETRLLKREKIPFEAPDKVLTREHLDSKMERTDMLAGFVEAMNSKGVRGTDFKKNFRLFIEQNDIEQDVVDIISETMGRKEDER